MEKIQLVGETGIVIYLQVCQMRVGETGVCEMGQVIGEMGVGEMGVKYSYFLTYETEFVLILAVLENSEKRIVVLAQCSFSH